MRRDDLDRAGGCAITTDKRTRSSRRYRGTRPCLLPRLTRELRLRLWAGLEMKIEMETKKWTMSISKGRICSRLHDGGINICLLIAGLIGPKLSNRFRSCFTCISTSGIWKFELGALRRGRFSALSAGRLLEVSKIATPRFFISSSIWFCCDNKCAGLHPLRVAIWSGSMRSSAQAASTSASSGDFVVAVS